jgi:hypothetical protein
MTKQYAFAMRRLATMQSDRLIDTTGIFFASTGGKKYRRM